MKKRVILIALAGLLLLMLPLLAEAAGSVPTWTRISISPNTVEVGETVTITATTTKDAEKLRMTLKGGASGTKTQTWTGGYTDSASERSWKVTYTFNEPGDLTAYLSVGNAAGWSDENEAVFSITVDGPTLSGVSFSKAQATVKQNVTITAVTSTSVTKLKMYSGSSLVKSWTTSYTDSGYTRTWKVTYAFAGAGKRTMTFKAEANGIESAAKTASITITAAPTLSSVAFSKASATVKQNITITAVTSTTAVKLSMYSGGSLVKSWTGGYTDSGSTRTWKVSYAFAGAGNRTVSFKAADANGVLTAEKTASITITKAPTLTSVAFSKAQASVNQNVTITAVTSTTAAKLNMYAGDSMVKSWTSGYTDSGSTRTWKVTYAFAGAGNRTLSFKAADSNGVLTAAKTASIVITKAPTLSSITLSRTKATVKQDITITAVTSTTATKLNLYSGSSLVKSWTTGYTDSGSTRTWKVTYAFAGAGNRTVSFKAGDSNGAYSAAATVTVLVTKAPELTSVAFGSTRAAVGANVTITAVTSTTATKLNMYSGSSLVKSWTSGYTDSGTTRTWKVTYAFAGAGNRTVSFKAGDGNGVLTAAKSASITITAMPVLNSATFASSATGKEVTVTAVTSTNVTKLGLYSGSTQVKAWTSGYTDSGTSRTWKVTFTVAETGGGTLTLKAFDAYGTAATKTANITIAVTSSN